MIDRIEARLHHHAAHLAEDAEILAVDTRYDPEYAYAVIWVQAPHASATVDAALERAGAAIGAEEGWVFNELWLAEAADVHEDGTSWRAIFWRPA